MSELGAARTDSGPPPPASPVPNALRALRERASTVLPGLYAWLTTVALPSAQQRASGATRVTALLALVSLLAAPLFVSQRPVLARCLGIFSFLGCSLLTWVLLGAGLLQNPNDPLLSALGAVAFTLYALGWGSLRRRGAVPEDGPNVIPGPPLQPRGKPQRGTPIVFGVIVACAFVPIFLAFRVAEPERALFAHAAARSRLAERGLLPVAERSAFARAVLEGLKADALARGPATEAELTELTARRWQDFDRPPSSRTMHAVVLVDAPASDAKARAVAERIRSAVLGITDPEAFMTAARAVPHEGVEVRVERLPAVTPDGRTYYPEGAPPDAADQRFDPAFARAANELAVGQISEPTKSAFGYHVILCEAHLPELRVSAAERRVRLNDQLLKQRAEAAKQALLKELSARGSVQIARSADDLTARVQVIE